LACLVGRFILPIAVAGFVLLFRGLHEASKRITTAAWEAVRPPPKPQEIQPAEPVELVANYEMVHHLERLNGIPLSKPEPEQLEYDVTEMKCGDDSCLVCGEKSVPQRFVTSSGKEGVWDTVIAQNMVHDGVHTADGPSWCTYCGEHRSRAVMHALQTRSTEYELEIALNRFPSDIWAKRRTLSGQTGPVEVLAFCVQQDHPEAVLHSWNGYNLSLVCDRCRVDMVYLRP